MGLFNWLFRRRRDKRREAEQVAKAQGARPPAAPEHAAAAHGARSTEVPEAMRPSPISEGQFFDYLEVSNRNRTSYRPGQLYFAPCLYPFNWPYVVVPTAPTNHACSSGECICMLRRYSSGQRSLHFPLSDLQLEANEQLFALKGKVRLCIVLGQVEGIWGFGPLDKSQKLCLVAPVFGLKGRHSEAFITKVRTVAFPNLFYLPGDATAETRESVVRLETIQPVAKGTMLAYKSQKNHMLVRLTEEKYNSPIRHWKVFVDFAPPPSPDRK